MTERTIVIFGAESDTGYRVAQLARRDGRSVIGVTRKVLRDPAPLERLKLQLAVADSTRRESVDQVFAGLDGPGLEVVCFIGGTPQLNSQGNINVIDAAQAAGVRRFVLTTSIGCGDSAVVIDPFVKAFAGKSIRAKDWAENRLKETDMAWSIVRSGGMTLRAGKEGPMLVENPNVVGYINRTDLGDMVYAVLVSPKSVHRVFAAVDRGKAMDIRGRPLVPAEL